MHSMSLAITKHVPVIGLFRTGKIDSLFSAIGRSSFPFELEDFDPKTIANQIKVEFLQADEIQTGIEDGLESIRALARQNATIAAKLISDSFEEKRGRCLQYDSTMKKTYDDAKLTIFGSLILNGFSIVESSFLRPSSILISQYLSD